jgi:hypothetical protein
MIEARDTEKYGRLSDGERERLGRQLGMLGDRGRICSGTKGEVEDEIVKWVEELRMEFPSTYRSHSTCRAHAVRLANRIMGIVEAKKGKEAT